MVNNEQILELVLEYLSGDPARESGFAGEALVYYILQTYPDLQTSEEIAEKFAQLIVDHNIAKLHSKNLIEVEIDENGEELIYPVE